MSTFDAAFSDQNGAFFDVFGESVSYRPSEGATVLGIQLDFDEEDGGSDQGGPEFYGVKRSTATGRVQASQLSPAEGGVFVFPSGRELKIDAPPRREHDDWLVDLVEVKASG